MNSYSIQSALPIVSVIVPAYNAELFIEETLNSILTQTYKNIEVLVVDDGSQDQTAAIVERVMQRDHRVGLLKQPNAGVAAARNLAIQKSKGEFIAPIDADDIWFPQNLEKQVQCLELCDQALWLRQGQVIAYGEPEVITGQYVAEMRSETQRRTPVEQPPILTPSGTELKINENRFGSLELEIVDLQLLDDRGNLVTAITPGDPLHIVINYFSHQPAYAPIFGVNISQADGTVCYDTDTSTTGLSLPLVQGVGQISLRLKRLDLRGGKYFVNVGIYAQDWAYAYDYHWHAYPLLIHLNSTQKGILSPPHHWKIGTVQAPTRSPIKK